MNYYNEWDKPTASWLRELVRRGLVPNGVVDDRSITDVSPSDLRGFTQCHFFAGVGGWSLALQRAGWAEDRPVWTGSCPCQPFSTAGEQEGFNDDRHLWPAFAQLIRECGPPIVFGEQVASKVADKWIDLVCTDMEAMGYAFGAVPFPSAGVGAPHLRDRNYWMGYGIGEGLQGHAGHGHGGGQPGRQRAQSPGSVGPASWTGSLDNTNGQPAANEIQARGQFDRMLGHVGRPGATNGFWRDADWLYCRDGKWRPVEPASFPLAHGIPARVVRLRGYGNAINVEAARTFIEVAMEIV